jgi:hypothetical protein
MRSRFALITTLGLGILPLGIAQTRPESAPAPSPMMTAVTSSQRDLATWDDVFVARDAGLMLLLREGTLFALGDSAGAAPSQLATHPALASSRIVAYADSGKRRWVFLNSTERAPFALDLSSGTLAEFPIPGLRVPGKQASSIQSFLIAPHLGAALLMISGGDPGTWPRPENRPLYFRMSLDSGQVIALPVGWDLHFYTADQRVAFFFMFPNHDRVPQAFDLSSGELLREAPSQGNTAYTDFEWQDLRRIKPVRGLAGLSLNGEIIPFDLGVRDARLKGVDVHDGFAGFRVWTNPASYDLSDLWIIALERDARPELVASGVTDVVMMGAGTCVFRSAVFGHNPCWEEAYFRTRSAKVAWNLLEGVQRLPRLAKEFAESESAREEMSVKLVGGFGGPSRHARALGFFRNTQRDLEARVGAERPPHRKRLADATWQRLVVVTAEGQRYMTDLLREDNPPEELWFHNAGRVLMGRHSWTETGLRRVHLVETSLELPAAGR